MTLNELAYSLLNLIRADYKAGDYIDIRQLYHFIHTQRALWLRKELSKPYPNLGEFEQDLGCLQLETIDTTAYCTDVGNSGCNVLQTVKDMPEPLYKKGLPMFTRIGPVDKLDTNFDRVSAEAIKTFGSGRFNSQLVGAFYEKPKIKIKSKAKWIGGLEYINVKGIFANPEDVKGFNLDGSATCFDPDDKYPIDSALIDYLHGDIVKYKLQMYIDTPDDKINDGTIELEKNGV